MRCERKLTASGDEQSLALCIEGALGGRDTIVGLAVVGLDLGWPDLRDVLEVVRHVGWLVVSSWSELRRCVLGRGDEIEIDDTGVTVLFNCEDTEVLSQSKHRYW